MLPLARPRLKNAQLEFSHALSSQRENDPESALMHYRARSYDPRMGRFVQKDPIKDQKEDLYSYASNSPTQRKDPTGEFSWGIQIVQRPLSDIRDENEDRPSVTKETITTLASVARRQRANPALGQTNATPLPVTLSPFRLVFTVEVPSDTLSSTKTRNDYLKVMIYRHEMKHVIADATFAEIIFNSLENRMRHDVQNAGGSMSLYRLEAFLDWKWWAWFADYKSLGALQDRELHRIEQILVRPWWKPNRKVELSGEYALSDWIGWVNSRAFILSGGLLKDLGLGFGGMSLPSFSLTAQDAKVKNIKTQFDNALKTNEGLGIDDYGK